ncbi:hypothetical protein FTRO_0340050 [Fructobacillus tropaeoli]|uniref:Uncharacterized protein n=2 Tax=Fructobacillus tropaeoli TaxID=709323 RepID=A0A3F3H679_9LACO|nr:hypothetical protein FTRO_0340050 [Fructobacillus tropaeoli]
MSKQELIGKLNMQRDILMSLYQDPNIDVDVLKSSLYGAFCISGLAIDVLEEVDEEDE